MMDEFDIAELALKACGVEQSTIDGYNENGQLLNKASELLIKKFNVDLLSFFDLIPELIKFTPMVSTECGDKYHAFVDPKTSRLIVKEEVQQ